MMRQAIFEIEGPVAVRYPRGGEGVFCLDTSGEAVVRLREGSDVTLLGYGIAINHLLEAADRLEKEGISATVIKMNRIAPLEASEVAETLGNTDTLLVLEDAFNEGCVGQRIAAMLSQQGMAPKKLLLRNLEKSFAPEGSVAELEHRFGLDADGVVSAILEVKHYGQ